MLLLGKRQGFPRTLMLPHSPSLTMAGAALLWVGWFGFNGGSALAASDDAASAIINTHLGASTAALAWLLIERIKVELERKLGFLGFALFRREVRNALRFVPAGQCRAQVAHIRTDAARPVPAIGFLLIAKSLCDSGRGID